MKYKRIYKLIKTYKLKSGEIAKANCKDMAKKVNTNLKYTCYMYYNSHGL